MPEPATNSPRAELRELDAEFTATIKAGGKTVKVQFNPETLKVSFANQIVQPSGGGDQRGSRRASSSARARPSSRSSCGST